MHSQTVWMLVFYLFCCLTSLLGYLLISLNVWHTNHPSCGPFFFNPAAERDVSVSVKKTIQGKSHEQKYTPDLVLNKWQNIQENLCNEYYHFIPLKMDQKFSKKTQESPLDCSSHISFAWYYHEKPRLHRKFESPWLAASKKKRDGGFLWVDIPGTNETSTQFKMAEIGWLFLIFTMERWLEIIKLPSIHKWLAKWIPRYLFFMFRIGIPKFHGKFSRTKSNLRKLWSLIFGHTVSQTKKKSKTYRQIKKSMSPVI